MMNYVSSLRRALLLILAVLAISKISHSQTITEDLIANPNNLISYGGPSPIIFPCGSHPDGSYHFEVTLEFPIGTQLTINEPSDGNSTLFDIDDAILTNVSVDNVGVYTMESTIATVLIPITFCNYSGAGFSPLEYDVLTPLLGVLSIITHPFEIGIQALSIETEYSSSDEVISNSVDADLYFQNLDHEFTRTSTFSPYSELSGTVKINSLIMEYYPEDEIDLVSLTISTPSSSSSFTGTIPSFFDFLQLGLLDESIIQSEEFTITEVFTIKQCSAEVFGEGSIGATSMNFKLCECFEGFNFNHIMNATIEDDLDPIDYCFDILPNQGIDPCSNQTFDVEFSFYNPGGSEDQENGMKELGWVVIPIDLEAFGITSIADLFVPGRVQLRAHSIGAEGSHCSWGPDGTSIDLSTLDPNFVNYYSENLGFPDGCTPNEPDDFRRIAFNFSLLDQNVGNALINWYDDSVFNTFNTNSKFSIVFSDLTIDLDNITVIDVEANVLGENPLVLSSNPEWGCGNEGYTFFQANGGSALPNVWSANNSYYTVYRTMCEQLISERDNLLEMRPQLYLEDSEFLLNDPLVGCSPEFEEGIQNPFVHVAEGEDYITYNNNNEYSAYAEALDGDFELELPGSSLAIEFDYGMYLNEIADLNLWDFNPGEQVDLFNPCPSTQLMGRISMPIYLDWYEVTINMINDNGTLGPNIPYSDSNDELSCTHNLVFEAPDLGCISYPCNSQQKIRVTVVWPSALTECPDAIEGCPLFPYNTGEMVFSLAEECVCSSPQSLALELACASHIVTYRCGTCSVSIGGAENTAGEPSAEFNMVEDPNNDEFFRVKRNTFGYPTNDISFDPVGPAPAQIYNGETGFPLDALDEDGILPQTGLLPFADADAAELNGCNLYRVYPGDELRVEAFGIYKNLAPQNGNIEMAFAIQTFTPEDHFIIPDVPSGEITFTNQDDGSIEVFQIETITMGQCPTMDEMNNPAGTPMTTVTFSLGDDFYNAVNGLVGQYDMAFSSSIQMYTDFFPINTVEPHELIVWTGNFVTTGIGDLPLGQEPEPSDYCWIEQTCDFYSAAITCLNIRSWIDFELLVPESMFQSCSRPYVFEFYSAGGINFDHFPNEYRPTIGLRSVEMNNIEGLDFTHDYNGGPWGFTTVSIDGDGSELEFIVNATDDLMTVDFSALPIPDHQTNQHQYRLFGGHAVDVDGCQQIGMEGDIQFGNYPLTMNEDAIDAKFEYVNFLSVDNPLLNDVEHIDDPNNEHVGDDLQIHRVGFYATDDGPEPVLSSNGGSITGQEIHYINPNTHIGGLYGGVTTTTGFFVIPENTPEVTVTQVSLIKMVNGIQIGTPIVGVSHNSDPGTLFFHRDHSGLCVNDFLNCAWDEHLFRVHPDNQWFLVFDYNLEQCPIDADGNNENTFEFNYFFGTACGTDGDPNSPNFDMTRCQTCLSYFGNCADCNCSDNGIVDSHSIFTEYSGEMDAYVDQVQLYLPNALLNADINDVSATCAPEYTVNLAVPMPDGALYMDAENIILTIQYPDNWINLPVVTLDCLNCLVDVIQTEPGLAEVSLTQDNSPLVISSGETISLGISFPGPTASVEGDLVEFNVNAQTICGETMPVSNGSSVFNVDPSSNNNLTATFNAIDESCIGSTGAEDGQLTVNVSGGSGMYEVLWVTCPNGQLNCEGETDWTISGLMAGDYTVVVTDTDTGCSSQFTTTVNLGPCCELSMGTTLTPPDVCAGESVYQLLVDIQNQFGITTITITPDDGVVALGSGQYEISDCGLDYTVTVTDGSGCNPVSDVIFIDCVNFSPPTFDIAVSEMDCRPEDGSYTPSNGEISVNVTGGSDCMTYSWECPVSMENCPPPSSDPNLSNAVVGWYTLTWEDCTYGCTGTETIQVTTVPCCSVDFSPVVTNIIGCNSCSGSIVLNPSVSQLNYQYQWTGPGDFTSVDQNLFNLCAGEYFLTVMYGSCTAEFSYSIELEEGALDITLEEILPDVCNGDFNPEVTPIVTGASGTYEIGFALVEEGGLYSENNGIYTLSCGYNYQFEVMDSSGCVATVDFYHACSEFEIPTFEAVVTETECQPLDGSYTPSGGSISFNYSGPDSGMSYSWECPPDALVCPDDQSTAELTDAIPGTYVLNWTWTDGQNTCTGSETVEVTAPPCCDLEFEVSSILEINECEECSGSIELTPSILDYQVEYDWNTGGSSNSISSLCSGTYSVVAGYAETCTYENQWSVVELPAASLELEMNSLGECAGEVINFTIEGQENCESPMYEWTVTNSEGDNFNGTGSSISFTIPNDGEYLVCATQTCGGIQCGEEVCSDLITIEDCSVFNNCLSIQDNISNPNYFTGGRGVIDTPTGYVISGATHVSSSNSDQFLVEKSHDDQVIFQTKFGEKAFAYGPTEQAEDLVMHNNHIYTVGSSRYSDTGYDVVVSRYDYVTKVLEDARSFTFSNTSNDFGNAIDVIVKDGQSFLLVGGSTNVQDTDGDMLAMLINPISLQLDSYRLYDNNSRRDDCKDVVVLSTGEAVLVGQSATKATAIKIESNLDLISSEQFTFNQGRTWINSIIESNGRLYMVGAMNSNPDNDVLLIRSNLNLDITFNEFTTWSSFYNDTSTDEEALEISRHPSGRLFMVGKVTRGSDEDGFAAFLGADLSIQWVKKVNEPSNSVLHSLTFSDDNEGTYMVATGKIDMDINDQDLFIVKWRTNEDICCLEEYKMRSRAFNIATQPHMDEQFRSKHNKSEVRIEDTNYPCVSLCEVGLISLRSATEIYGGQEEHGLSINPNPNNGHFELQLNSETNSLIEVSVLDASGKLINSRKFSEDQDITSDNFNYLHLRSGFYVVKVTLDNGDVLTSRIVVQK